MTETIRRSPFFYVGDKYKLMNQLRVLFPQNITTYVEPFVGGGSSFLNTNALKYLLNDVDFYVIQLHKTFMKYKNKHEYLLNKMFDFIKKYDLSCSYKGHTVPSELKKKYVKTYYSHYNKVAYNNMKKDFNEEPNYILLYLLLIYGFNHMIRFNSKNDFNLPVGNVDFNKNVYNALLSYFDFIGSNDVEFFNYDYKEFLSTLSLDKSSFVYLDPPYLISGSEYNKLWNENMESELYAEIDKLNEKKIHFGITNLISHKGKINEICLEWSKKYKVYNIESNYISFNDNTIKKDSREVYITNYE